MKFEQYSKIEYIKIIVNESATSYISTKYKLGDNMITASVDTDNKIYLTTPRDVVVCYVTDEAMYSAQTQLLSLQYSNYVATFVLKTPEEFERQQERKYFRVKIDKEAEIIYTENGVTKTIPCRTSDLSAGGVRLILKNRPEIPSDLTVNLLFDNKTYKLNAKLVKCYYNDNVPTVGLQFVDMTEKQTDDILSICFKKQIQDINSKKK